MKSGRCLLSYRLPWAVFFRPFCRLISSGERALTPALPLLYFSTNSIQSATLCALRISADTGSSFGARGTLSKRRPASFGRRSPFFAFTALLDQTRFSHASLPPRERGTMWSRLPSSGFSNSPVYWQRLPSRSRIVFAHSFGRFFGTFAKFTATMTVGTRIGPRTVCTALSCSRTGSVIHSSHVTGRSASARAPWPNSISSAVATLVAIMQNASCGVRMLIACQLRFSTSTIVLFSMSDIKIVAAVCDCRCFRHSRSAATRRCLFFVVFVSHLSTINSQCLQNWLPRLVLLQVLRCQRPAHS